MVCILNRLSFSGFDVLMHYDNVCEFYTVRVVYRNSQRNFFIRDYRTKRSATRSFNSWVTKLSAIDTRFAEVRHD